MLSHICVGCTDFDRALRFHSAVMTSLGHSLRFCEPEQPWAGWNTTEGGRPLFIVGRPFDGKAHDAGNGQMVAFAADSREQVRRVYQTALEQGGSCEGPPGPRPHYHAHYYGAYFRDPDGNKFCVACHTPEANAE